MSDSARSVFALLRAEFAEEAASQFARLRRTPQTDIIWFLDYFPSLTEENRKALLDALADRRAMEVFPRRTATLQVAPALAQLREARNRPGSKGGTRYTGVQMLGMEPSFREPGGYHQSWRESFCGVAF